MTNPVFVNPDALDAPAVIATYQVLADPDKIEKTAANIAVGQTLGTWTGTESTELMNYLARVVGLEPLETQDASINLPAGKRLFAVRIVFPVRVVESDPGTLLTVLFGKLSMAGAVRLIDVTVPEVLARRWHGPRFGVEGIRRLTGVQGTPLLMSIFKPCLGLLPEQLGEMFYHQALGGANLVKDDEILSDASLDSDRRRLAACLAVLDRVKAETGSTCLYAINLTGPAHELLDRARTLVADGANALLFNYLSYGLPMLAALRQDPEINIPLVAHPSLAGAFYGSPLHGISPKVIFGQLPRLVGADLVLFPSPYGSVALPQEDAMAVADALRQPLPGLQPALPVPSAGITVEMVPRMVSDFGRDVVINAGTGIHDFPGGSREGAAAFVDAIRRECSQAAEVSGR